MAPEHADDGYEVVADGGGAEPEPHHEPFVFGRSYFRHEGDAHRREEELGKGEDEVGADEDGRGYEHAGVDDGRAVGVGRGEPHGAECHEGEAYGGDEHADADFTRRGGLFAPFCQCAEDGEGYGGEGYHEEGVELLEHLRQDFDGGAGFQGAVFPCQEDDGEHCDGA